MFQYSRDPDSQSRSHPLTYTIHFSKRCKETRCRATPAPAIVVPGVLTRHGSLYISVHNDQMWAVLIAAGVFYRTRNMMLMMAIGMAAFTVLRLYA